MYAACDGHHYFKCHPERTAGGRFAREDIAGAARDMMMESTFLHSIPLGEMVRHGCWISERHHLVDGEGFVVFILGVAKNGESYANVIDFYNLETDGE